MFNPDFYPTPPEVAATMLDSMKSIVVLILALWALVHLPTHDHAQHNQDHRSGRLGATH